MFISEHLSEVNDFFFSPLLARWVINFPLILHIQIIRPHGFTQIVTLVKKKVIKDYPTLIYFPLIELFF